MKLIYEFNTCQCHVMVYDSETTILNLPVYCITSRHFNNDKLTIRFGNKIQIQSIINSNLLNVLYELIID